ncbi:MAG: hypothetical protein HY426_03270 [Candidatus Levybacteria bacterium]|nr:hypothetical protein [Candidatus Levybacteria bacterium]
MDIKELSKRLAEFDQRLKQLDEIVTSVRVEIVDIIYGIVEVRKNMEAEISKADK